MFVMVIPYRDRLEHLNEFVPFMEEFLKDHEFRILVVHQADDKLFNKGKLFNIGLSVAGDADYFCLHDIDLLPLDRTCDYSPPRRVAHLLDRLWQRKIDHPTYLGGAFVTTAEAFRAANGFSNQYWGWGLEDEDFLIRLWLAGVEVDRRPGWYRSLPHEAPPVAFSRERFQRTLAEASLKLGDAAKRASIEGLKRSLGANDSGPSDYRKDGLRSLDYAQVGRAALASLPGLAAKIRQEHEIVSVRV